MKELTFSSSMLKLDLSSLVILRGELSELEKKKKKKKNDIKIIFIIKAQKNLIKLFYALNKTYALSKSPLGETGYLSNLYYLLASQASK